MLNLWISAVYIFIHIRKYVGHMSLQDIMNNSRYIPSGFWFPIAEALVTALFTVRWFCGILVSARSYSTAFCIWTLYIPSLLYIYGLKIYSLHKLIKINKNAFCRNDIFHTKYFTSLILYYARHYILYQAL